MRELQGVLPTIFSLASQGLGRRAPAGSGIIGVAIVGGAVVPPLTGHMADLIGLRAARGSSLMGSTRAGRQYRTRPVRPSTITARVSSHENARRA